MKKLYSLILASVVIAATSCTPQYGPYGNQNSTAVDSLGQMGSGNVTKQGMGTIAGAVGGGFIGNQIGKGKGNVVATAAGAILGGLVGSEVGKSLDNADRAYMMNTQQAALEQTSDGIATPWRNPNSGNSGTITPTRVYQEGNTYCREFSQTINVGGQQEKAFGNACRQPDGSWKVVN